MRWLGSLAIACLVSCAPPVESQTTATHALAQRLLDRFVEPVFESIRVETAQTLDCESLEGVDARQCQLTAARFKPVLEKFLAEQRTVARTEMAEVMAEFAAIDDNFPGDGVAALAHN